MCLSVCMFTICLNCLFHQKIILGYSIQLLYLVELKYERASHTFLKKKSPKEFKSYEQIKGNAHHCGNRLRVLYYCRKMALRAISSAQKHRAAAVVLYAALHFSAVVRARRRQATRAAVQHNIARCAPPPTQRCFLVVK